MKQLIKKALLLIMLLTFILPAVNVDAYVSVKGYYRSDGTYVAPYVRSNPNGLKYDNYGWTPSQGMFNPSYGTRGTEWDTPTYITDPDYYEGKSLYENNQAGSVSPVRTQSERSVSNSELNVPANASLNYFGTDWSCDSGYKISYSSNYQKTGCTKITVPSNASLNYYGSDWSCNSGYKTSYDNSFNKTGCKEIAVPSNASLNYYGSDWSCNTGYKTTYNSNIEKTGCEKIQVPANASLNYYGSDWSCNSGYKTKYDSSIRKTGCERIVVPNNATLNYYGSDWVCNSGYTISYDSSYTKVGCKVR